MNKIDPAPQLRSGERCTAVHSASAEAIVDLPARETLTLFSGNIFPTVSPTMPTDQGSTGGATSTIGDTTSSTTSLANSTAQSAPAQNGATAQNVLSPGATSYATQSQYAPVTGA